MTKKSFWKISSVLAIFSLAFALVFTSCGDDNGGPAAAMGDSPTMSGRVYTGGLDWEAMPNIRVRFDRYEGSATLRSWPSGVATGNITNGQLSVNLSVPASTSPVSSLINDMDGAFTNVSVTPAAARFAWLDLGTTDDRWLSRGNASASGTMTSFNGNWEDVGFIFVDQDVTISATGINEDGFRSDSFTINLRRGWNAVRTREELSNFNFMTDTGNIRIRVDLSNSGRWMLEDDDDWGFSAELSEVEQALRDRAAARSRARARQ